MYMYKCTCTKIFITVYSTIYTYKSQNVLCSLTLK